LIDSSRCASLLAYVAVDTWLHSLYVAGDVLLRKRADASEIVGSDAVRRAGSYKVAIRRSQARFCAAGRDYERS